MKRFLALLVPAGAIGSAGLAALATACCVGPVVVALFGVGGAVAAASMIPYRPYLLGLALVLAVSAGWAAYRPRTVCTMNQCTTPRPARVAAWTAIVVTTVSAVVPFFA